MAEPYSNTISGLLKRRSELMADARELRERMAVVGNDIAALDRTLETLGYQGDMPAAVGVQSSTRVVYFHRNELRRFCLDELRESTAPSPRAIWQKRRYGWRVAIRATADCEPIWCVGSERA